MLTQAQWKWEIAGQYLPLLFKADSPLGSKPYGLMENLKSELINKPSSPAFLSFPSLS